MLIKAKLSRIERIKRLYKKNPSEILKAVYAYLLAKEGYISEALDLLDERNVYGLYVYGNLLTIEGELERAVEVFCNLIDWNPFYLGVRKSLAKVLLDLGKKDEAKKHFQFILTFFEDPESQKFLEEELEEEVEIVEESDEILEDEKVIVLDEDLEPLEELGEEEFLTLELVESLIQQCLFEEALEKLEKILEREPENEEAHALLEKLNFYLEFLEPEEPKA